MFLAYSRDVRGNGPFMSFRSTGPFDLSEACRLGASLAVWDVRFSQLTSRRFDWFLVETPLSSYWVKVEFRRGLALQENQ
jgi:hypothetical protein